jgi:hypothetical protein
VILSLHVEVVGSDTLTPIAGSDTLTPLENLENVRGLRWRSRAGPRVTLSSFAAESRIEVEVTGGASSDALVLCS